MDPGFEPGLVLLIVEPERAEEELNTRFLKQDPDILTEVHCFCFVRSSASISLKLLLSVNDFSLNYCLLLVDSERMIHQNMKAKT